MLFVLHVSYGMRYIAKVLKNSLHKKFPDATEDELLKVETLEFCLYHFVLPMHSPGFMIPHRQSCMFYYNEHADVDLTSVYQRFINDVLSSFYGRS